MEVELRFWIGDPAEGVSDVRSDLNREIWALYGTPASRERRLDVKRQRQTTKRRRGRPPPD